MNNKTLEPRLIKEAQKENPFAKLGEIVYQILETQILSLALDPGSKLRINTIAEDLNISATPVREAIDLLEENGLVVANKGSGGKYKSYSVFDIDDKEVQDLFVVRKAIESTSAEICAQRNWTVDMEHLDSILNDFRKYTQKYIDEGGTLELNEIDIDFHTAIVRYSGNQHLYNVYTSLGKKLQYLSIRTCEFMTGDPEREDLKLLYVQHKSVLNSIEMGMPELARQSMASHIDFCAENCIKNRYLLEKNNSL